MKSNRPGKMPLPVEGTGSIGMLDEVPGFGITCAYLFPLKLEIQKVGFSRLMTVGATYMSISTT